MIDKNACGCSCDCGCSPEEAAACGPEKTTALGGSPMDTQIFKLGLGILPTSVYIIIAALQADGTKPTASAISSRWNDKPQTLEAALAELQSLNIIVKHPGKEAVYLVNPASMWVPNNQDD